MWDGGAVAELCSSVGVWALKSWGSRDTEKQQPCGIAVGSQYQTTEKRPERWGTILTERRRQLHQLQSRDIGKMHKTVRNNEDR
jgi:hypothetical protein